jgi:hypothetical protein
MKARILVVLAVVAMTVAAVAFQGYGDNDAGDRPCCPVCGDGVCTGDEKRCNCPQDCHADGFCVCVAPMCGDGSCQRSTSPGESHERCPADCPLECRPCR